MIERNTREAMESEVQALMTEGIVEFPLVDIVEWNSDSPFWEDCVFVRNAKRVAGALSTPDQQIEVSRAFIIPRNGQPYNLVVELVKVKE